MTIIVAPTEPPLLKAIAGAVSMAPEKLGADILWRSPHWGLVGVQRKEAADFVASVHDGRLAKESQQMQRLGLAVLILEGRFRWTTDGELATGHGSRWSKASHRGVLRSLQAAGIWVEMTDDLSDTVAAVQHLVRWCAKDRAKHRSLVTRPAAPKNEWGVVSSRDYALWFLQGLEGIGPDAAAKILDHFGGMPIRWADGVGVEQLCQVDGIGKPTAEKLIVALGGQLPPPKPKRKRKAASIGPSPRAVPERG